jgi:hypothetical protein
MKDYFAKPIPEIDYANMKLDDLPIVLNVKQLSAIMQISIGAAYNMCHRDDFPSIYYGKKIVILTPAFKLWLQNGPPVKQQRA